MFFFFFKMPPPRPQTLQTLAVNAVAARLARDDKEGSYLSQVVAAAPLSLVSPCLVSLDDPLALAAVEDACGGEGSQGRELLEAHWRRLFLERFGARSALEQQQRKSGGVAPRWRLRYEAAEAAEAAEKEKLESLGAKLREREREEEARKRSVVVLQAPPRPLGPKGASRSSSSLSGTVNSTKRRSVASDPRQRIAKKLASGSTARGAATVAATAAAAARRTAAATAAARAPSSFPNVARPLVRPGNEVQMIRRTRISSGAGGGGGGGGGGRVLADFEEISLFD